MGKNRIQYRPGGKNRRAIIQFIKSFTQANGVPPTYRDIAANVGLVLSVVAYHIDYLERAGAITTMPGQSRTIRLTEKADHLIDQ